MTCFSHIHHLGVLCGQLFHFFLPSRTPLWPLNVQVHKEQGPVTISNFWPQTLFCCWNRCVDRWYFGHYISIVPTNKKKYCSHSTVTMYCAGCHRWIFCTLPWSLHTVLSWTAAHLYFWRPLIVTVPSATDGGPQWDFWWCDEETRAHNLFAIVLTELKFLFLFLIILYT